MPGIGRTREVIGYGVTYARALRTLWEAAPGYAAVMAAVLFVQGLLPPISVWLVKALIDGLQQHRGLAYGLALVAGWGLALLLGEVASQLQVVLQLHLNDRCIAYVEQCLIHKANAIPDLGPFETESFANRLEVVRREGSNRPLNLMVTTANVIPNLITIVGLSILVGSLAWWLPPLLVAVAVPSMIMGTRLVHESWQLMGARSRWGRVMRYLVEVATTAAYAKEVRLFGFGVHLEERYRAAVEEMLAGSRANRQRRAVLPLASTLMMVGGMVVVVAWTVSSAFSGKLTAGDVALLLQSLISLRAALSMLVAMVSLLAGHLLYFSEFFSFLDYRSELHLAAAGRRLAAPFRQGIILSGVYFRYPSGTQALEDVSLQIPAGSRVALVGENGAGKSTVVKLLCRFYDPDRGTVTVDGIDLRELDLVSWRARIGAVFQDFGRYKFTVAENIALARLDALDDPELLAFAARRAGLAAGLDTMLGPDLGGSDLSSGQWQTLAIARALVRDADLLILDEPTAALDPRAEYELFERFAQLAEGRTTVFVTHRLGSVRMADRILVLKRGRLVEQGTHDELLGLGGEYADLYRLQASQYLAAPGQ